MKTRVPNLPDYNLCQGIGTGGGVAAMESDLRYYMRRLGVERAAAARALTVEARDRRLQLVEVYVQKLAALGA